MSAISEPMSKCQVLAAIRAEVADAMAAIAVMEAAPVDSYALREAEEAYDTAANSLVALHRHAEEAGLMQELADFLTASYGG